MINKDAKILVAVSGGVDSVYMLHMLVEQGYTNLGVVHFNHHARPEADMERSFIIDLARKHQFVYHDTGAYVQRIAEKRKESFELVARELRRESFQKLREGKYDWLALGQHADDQAETVLFNFLRGSGVHGLAGMLAEDKKQKIFRPLLNMTKEEIYKHAIDANLEWHEDHTNQESDYDRNWLRNDIIPQLEKRRSGVKKVLTDTATRMQDMSDYLMTVAQDWFDENFLGNGERLSANHFMSEYKVLRAEILGLMWEYYNGSRKDFKNVVVFEVEKWLSSNPEGGTKVFFGDYVMTIKKGLVTFEKR